MDTLEKDKAISADIVRRFFIAIRELIEMGELRGMQTFTRLYKINRRNLYQLEKEPERSIFRVSWLTYLVEDFNISAQWLLTGRGGHFIEQNRQKTEKKCKRQASKNIHQHNLLNNNKLQNESPRLESV